MYKYTPNIASFIAPTLITPKIQKHICSSTNQTKRKLIVLISAFYKPIHPIDTHIGQNGTFHTISSCRKLAGYCEFSWSTILDNYHIEYAKLQPGLYKLSGKFRSIVTSTDSGGGEGVYGFFFLVLTFFCLTLFLRTKIATKC